MLASNKSQQAVDELKSLADRTNSKVAIMELGLIHTKLKQFDAARSDYERLLKIDPQFTPALNDLAPPVLRKPGAARDGRTICSNTSQRAAALRWLNRRHTWLDPFQKRRFSWRARALILEAAEKNPADSEGPVPSWHGPLHARRGGSGTRLRSSRHPRFPPALRSGASALQRLGWIALDLCAKSSNSIEVGAEEAASCVRSPPQRSGGPRRALPSCRRGRDDVKEARANFEAGS